MGGIIVVEWNYGVLFIVWSIVMAVTLVYGIVGIKNVIPAQKVVTDEIKEQNESNAVLKKLKLDKFIISFRVTMKKRKGYTRGKILALCIAMCTPIIAKMGKYLRIEIFGVKHNSNLYLKLTVKIPMLIYVFIIIKIILFAIIRHAVNESDTFPMSKGVEIIAIF